MSNFFQNSLKKQKNCLNENGKVRNSDNKTNKLEKTDKNSSNDSSKKKNSKKFMISPSKDQLKENNEKSEYNYEKDLTIFNNQFSLNENDNIFQNVNKNSFSFKYNRHVSPLYTNMETVKKSISSTLSYEHIYNPYENINYNSLKKDNYSDQVISTDKSINEIISFDIDSTRIQLEHSVNRDECHSTRIPNEHTFEISSNNKYNLSQKINLENSIRDNIIENLSEKSSLNNNCISFNIKNGDVTTSKDSKKNESIIQETSKIIDRNYTTINKLNFNSLSCEPTLTYIQKDKFKLYNYNIMIDTNTQNLVNCNCNIPCFYCRRNFENIPLGIPVKYYPSLYILNDNSLQTSKYSFNYKENTIKLNKNERERLLNILTNNPDIVYENKYETKEQKREHKIITKNFFETDGIVCSFNCMVSFIEENSNNPLYQNSYNYSYLMYKHIFGDYPSQPFIRSPSWKLRKEYGGPLTDEDYSKYIQSIPIIESKQIKTINNNIKPEFIFEVLV